MTAVVSQPQSRLSFIGTQGKDLAGERVVDRVEKSHHRDCGSGSGVCDSADDESVGRSST